MHKVDRKSAKGVKSFKIPLYREIRHFGFVVVKSRCAKSALKKLEKEVLEHMCMTDGYAPIIADTAVWFDGPTVTDVTYGIDSSRPITKLRKTDKRGHV